MKSSINQTDLDNLIQAVESLKLALKDIKTVTRDKKYRDMLDDSLIRLNDKVHFAEKSIIRAKKRMGYD